MAITAKEIIIILLGIVGSTILALFSDNFRLILNRILDPNITPIIITIFIILLGIG